MSVRFVCGPAGIGKTQFCYSEIKNYIDNKIEKDNRNKKVVLIVPEQTIFEEEKNLVRRIGEGYVLDVKILTFKRIAHRVFNEVGGIAKEKMNSCGKNMMIYKVMHECKDKLKVFNRAYEKNGFVLKVSDTISEFKKFNISTDKVKEFSENSENITLRSKLEDLQLVYENFEEKLHENYIDSDDDLTILKDKISYSNIFKNAEVWFDSFNFFTPQQFEVIKEIIKVSERVNFILTLGKPEFFAPVFETRNKIVEVIEDENKMVASEGGRKIEIEKTVYLNDSINGRFKGSKELIHMEKNLLNSTYTKYLNEVNDISIFKALNKYSEAKRIAMEIKTICREEGARYRDIGVITGDLDGYEKILKVIFEEYNIPYFMDKKRQVKNNPIVTLILSAVEIISGNWSYDSVFKYLRTGFCDFSNEEIDLLENYVLATGIKGSKKWLSNDPWDYRFSYSNSEEVSPEEEAILLKVNETRFKLVNELENLQGGLKKKNTLKTFCIELYNFLVQIELPLKLEKIIDDFRNDGKEDLANEYESVWNIVIELLEQVVTVMGDEKVTIKEFYEILKMGVEGDEIGVIPATLDDVIISSADRGKNINKDYLFIIGCNDGVFPKPIPEDSLLTDKDRISLIDKGFEISKDSKSKVFEEQFMTYVTVCSSSKKLKFSYSISDDEGKGIRPSFLISKLKKVFPKIVEENDILNNDKVLKKEFERIDGDKSTFNELIKEIKYDGKKVDISELWIEVYSWFYNNLEWKDELVRVVSGFNYTNREENLDKSKIKKLYGTPLNLSVSKLESYNECPFAYFIKYGLKAKERKKHALTSPDIGSFMHSVIEGFSVSLGKYNKSFKDLEDEWCEALVNQVVDEKLKSKLNYIFNSSEKYKYMTERFKKIISKTLMVISEQLKKGGFVPEGFEVKFGHNGNYPPIILETSSKDKIEIVGRIDRIDLLPEEDSAYVRVIDYKSGRKQFKLQDVYYGLQMQLIVYLDSIIKEIMATEYIDCIPAAALYFRIDDPIIKEVKELTDEEIEEKVLKEMKMDGIVLEDIDVVRSMDNSIQKNSLVIPVSLKSNGEEFTSYSKVASLEQMNMLREYVMKKAMLICEDMINGNIDLVPVKSNSQSSCDYCEFQSVCLFDTSFCDNKIKELKNLSEDEVWKNIREEVSKNE